MGASFSSGHFSHPGHRARFTRAANHSPSPTTCGMCREKVKFNAAVYRCSEPGCSFILHDDCYRSRQTIKRHFAHQQQPLTLGPVSSELSCTLCARRLSRPAFAYSCTDRSCTDYGGGFHSHPLCCSLPKHLINEKHNEHGRLDLLPPSGRRNKCINCGNTAATGASAPWSYRCHKCDDVEQCLACLLDDDDDVKCRCVQCNPDDAVAAVHCLGELAGAFFRGFFSGMGCPGIPSNK